MKSATASAVSTALLLLTQLPATAKDICRSFPAQPDSFQGLAFGDSVRFQDTGAGVYIGFTGNRQILSVFKFDKDFATISDEVVVRSLSDALAELKEAVLERGDEVLDGPISASWPIGGVTFRWARLAVTFKQYDFHAYEYVGISHDTSCMQKVRFTDALENDPAESERLYESHVVKAHETFR
jgi:hypothetical protein